MDAWEKMFRDEREEIEFFLSQEFGEKIMSNEKQTITYLNTLVENALVFERSNGEHVNLSVQHFGEHHKVVFSVYAPDEPLDDEPGEPVETTEPDEPKELVTLSYQEARLLRDLLNRPEVERWLDQERNTTTQCTDGSWW